MEWMAAILTIGATARLTRLIGKDSITFFFRDWLAAMSQDPKDRSIRKTFFTFVEDMVACPWCLSIWVSAPVAVTAWLWGDTAWFLVPALALTASHMSGLSAQKES
jgi:hypothetical protein